jgi:flagellar biosynthesis protein FliQ
LDFITLKNQKAMNKQTLNKILYIVLKVCLIALLVIIAISLTYSKCQVKDQELNYDSNGKLVKVKIKDSINYEVNCNAWSYTKGMISNSRGKP